MHVHRSSPGFSFNSGCTYPLFRMHVHLPMSISARWLGCTYPLFRMHVHRRADGIQCRCVVLTHYSGCMFIRDLFISIVNALYLPTIQNACSSLLAWVLVQLRLYLPTIQNACSSTDEYKRKMARLYLPTIQDACSSQSRWHTMPLRCTYPLFRMHVHQRFVYFHR